MMPVAPSGHSVPATHGGGQGGQPTGVVVVVDVLAAGQGGGAQVGVVEVLPVGVMHGGAGGGHVGVLVV
jgi:hypothetical protein